MTADNRTHTCANCGLTFESSRSDEEGKQEAREREYAQGDPDDGEEWEVVCTPCYEKIMPWVADGAKPERVDLFKLLGELKERHEAEFEKSIAHHTPEQQQMLRDLREKMQKQMLENIMFGTPL